jgi:hypothetical protein
MDRLEVITEEVSGAAERLSDVSTVMIGGAATVASTAGAADDTAAAGAYSALLHRFTEALAGYGDHADALARATASAAECYEAADHL